MNEPTQEKRPSVLIATPMYGGMCTGGYVSGLLQTVQALSNAGISMQWAHMVNESLITRARNEIARVFLESHHEYLMFIDADISFPGDGVLQLLAVDKDVVCGLYPKKEVDWEQVSKAAKDGKENLKDYSGTFVLNFIGSEDASTNETGAIEVRHGGTGFMLIKRGVFEFLKDKVPTYRKSSVTDKEGKFLQPVTHEFFDTSIDESGALLSEDYHFCDLVRKHGGEIYAHPFVKLEHIGTYIYGGNILKSGSNLK